MTNFEKKIEERLKHGAEVYLKDAIERIISKDDPNQPLDADLLSLSCASMQIALELAFKAMIVRMEGIEPILDSKQKGLSENELQKKFEKNEIKVNTFDTTRSHLRSPLYRDFLKKEDNKIIDLFDRYRNKSVHFTCFFSENDIEILRDKLIFFMIHEVGKAVLGEIDHPSEYFVHILGEKLYNKLVCYEPYVKAMHELAKENSEHVVFCVYCDNETLSLDEEFCYCCNMGYTDYNRIDCPICGSKKTVIYDSLNIHYNNHIARGLCLSCREDADVFECPQCGDAYCLCHVYDKPLCNESKCVNRNEK